MKKLFTPFVFLAITGIVTACGEAPMDVPVSVLEIASEIECDEGDPDPNSFLCEFGDEGEG